MVHHRAAGVEGMKILSRARHHRVIMHHLKSAKAVPGGMRGVRWAAVRTHAARDTPGVVAYILCGRQNVCEIFGLSTRASSWRRACIAVRHLSIFCC